jgi:hypothetical protein
MMYNKAQLAFLKANAHYIWWEEPDQALKYPDRIIAQIMNMGAKEDVEELETLFSSEELSKEIHESARGQFFDWSWEEWHYRLGLIGPDDQVPPIPARQIGPNRFMPAGFPSLFDDMWRER